MRFFYEYFKKEIQPSYSKHNLMIHILISLLARTVLNLRKKHFKGGIQSSKLVSA